jgi:Growth inhibitor
MTPGTVVAVDFAGATGVKRRPAVVVSTLAYNNERPDVILAIVTSKVAGAVSTTDFILRDWSAAGLTKPSAVKIYLGTELSSRVKFIGKLSDSDWSEVQKRLRLALEV